MQTNRLRKLLDSVLGLLLMQTLALYGRVRRIFSARYRTDLADMRVSSILVIKLCCLGDGVLALPAIRALKRAYPEASLTVICTPRNLDAFTGHDFVDHLVSLQLTGLGGIGELLRQGPAALREALRAVRRCHPDLAVDLDLYYKATPVLAFLSGAPIRAGFDTAGKARGYLYTHSAPREPEKHEVLCFLDILAALGLHTDDLSLSLPHDDQAAASAARLLTARDMQANQPYAVIAPGSSRNWPVKRWTPEGFAAVAAHLRHAHDLPTVLIGAAFEASLGQSIADAVGDGAVSLVGATTVRETIELLREAAVVVSNDSGPMHLAAAVGVPVVAIFGPTNPVKWRPWTDRAEVVTAPECSCAPCYYLSAMPNCDGHGCLGQISVSSVTDAVDRLLGS
jgi:lipopolysaccharide heptosyltransferase II